MKMHLWLGLVCTGLSVTALGAETVIENFEYEEEESLRWFWQGSGNAVVTLSDVVAPQSQGAKSMRVQFNFPSTAWATESVQGLELENLLAIGSSQYVTFRLRGDPAFAAADFRDLYLYAYDVVGNFGRWGGAVPASDTWHIVNYPASTIQAPYNSPGLPDLARIVRLAFFQYGSEAALPAYTATIHIDDLMIRDEPLVEFPAPSAPRALIDDFEGYADDTALLAAYTYQNSPAATATAASLQTPAPQGDKALALTVDFAPGQYPWGSVRSPIVPPFSIASNAIVSFEFKGDPALAGIADGGTTFWLSFYDQAGNGIHFMSPAAPVISPDWTNMEVPFSEFTSGAVVDVGNLVQWRILVEGWQGTPEHTAMSGVFQVDNIRIAPPRPALAMIQEGATLKLGLNQLTAGKSYELKKTTDFAAWSTETVINATGATAEWTLTLDQPSAFYQLVEVVAP